MPLSDDQRAMLRLLAQRGEEGYDDVAALMGLSVEEVRSKVAEALAELAEEGALAPSQAAEPAAAAPAEPQAPPTTPARSKPSNPPKVSLPSGNGARAAVVAAVLGLVAVIVVLIASGGGDGDSTTTSAATTPAGGSTTEAEAAPASSKGVTKAILSAVDGGDATGVAIFGRVKNSLALQVEAEGLDPIPNSQSYTVWLAQSPQRMLPLASTPLDKNGRIAAQFEVPTEVLAYLANGTFDKLVVTRTANAALKAALAKATKEEQAPAYTGTEVLNGTVTGPIVGAQLRKEAEEKEEAE